ncbi:MAG: HIT family protein [Flavobacteriales bacterium]|nr:HIT family protein [Flavobacteriales bacterium]
MSSIFSKIVKGEIPCFKIDENDKCLAFLDINPNSFGHTLCILKREEDYIFDLDDNEYMLLMNFSKKIARALEKSVTCERIAMSVVGLEVPHVHIHLIPINTMQDLNFSNNLNLEKDSFEEVCNKIKSNLD